MLLARADPHGLAGGNFDRPDDDRGGFMRAFHAEAYAAPRPPARDAACNFFMGRPGDTRRSLECEDRPRRRGKPMRCPRYGASETMVDQRPENRAGRRWFGVRLMCRNAWTVRMRPNFDHGCRMLKRAVETTSWVAESDRRQRLCRAHWNDSTASFCLLPDLIFAQSDIGLSVFRP
jgi:dTDP-4-dehydrorhamnose 3,5-epimerase-like enzyme